MTDTLPLSRPVEPAEISESLRHLTAVAARLGGAVDQIGFYDGVFADYVEDLNAGVEWDCRLLAGALRDAGVVAGSDVIDVCCGSGRVGAYLAERGYVVVGIDRSATLLGRAPAATPARAVRWVAADLGATDVRHLLGRPPAAAVISAASVNCFPDARSLAAVFTAVATALRPGGLLLVPAFDDGARPRFATGFPDRLIGHPLRTSDGRHVVVWTSLGYHPPTATLHQAALVSEAGPGGVTHRYTYNVDRIWIASEVVDVLTGAGLRPVLSRPADVEGGGADGWPFRLLGFSSTKGN